MAPRETENNAYAKFWGDKQRALWYVMVFLEWSIEAVFSSPKLNFMHDGIVRLVASLCQLRVASMVLKVTSIGN